MRVLSIEMNELHRHVTISISGTEDEYFDGTMESLALQKAKFYTDEPKLRLAHKASKVDDRVIGLFEYDVQDPMVKILETLSQDEKDQALVRLIKEKAQLMERINALECELESMENKTNKGDGGRNFCP